MKAFYAEFLLLHSQRKPETGEKPSQLPQFTAGTNLSKLSFVNLIVMTMTRYMMKLIICEKKMNLLGILICNFILIV